MNTKEVRLSDRIEQFEEDLEEIAEDAEDADDEKFEELEQEYDQTVASIEKLESFAEKCEDPAVWTLRELNLAQALHAENVATGRDGTKDLSAEAMEILEQAVVDSPDGVPDNPAHYPIVVGMWLYQELGELMTGESGNSRPSLAERVGKE